MESHRWKAANKMVICPPSDVRIVEAKKKINNNLFQYGRTGVLHGRTLRIHLPKKKEKNEIIEMNDFSTKQAHLTRY